MSRPTDTTTTNYHRRSSKRVFKLEAARARVADVILSYPDPKKAVLCDSDLRIVRALGYVNTELLKVIGEIQR